MNDEPDDTSGDSDSTNDGQHVPTPADVAARTRRDDGGDKRVIGDDDSYPDETPWQEMTVAEQAAYWRKQAKKHESRAKARQGTDPGEVRKMRDELEKLRQASMSEQEKAVAEARTTAESETAQKWAQRVVKAELRAATAGRMKPDELDDMLAPVDLSWFLDDDNNVDTDRVRAFAGKFATGNGSGKFPDLGQGRREAGSKPSVASGRAAYAAKKAAERPTPTGQR